MIVARNRLYRSVVLSSGNGEYVLKLWDGELVEIASRDDSACKAEGKHYECSRVVGHKGRHVACAFEELEPSCPEEILEEWAP